MSAQARSEEAEIMQLAHTWIEAVQRTDLETLERLIAPEYVLQAQGLGRVSREEWMRAAQQSAYEIHSFTYEDVRIHIYYGDTAVMQSRYSQQATFQGQDRSGEMLITDVWVRRDEDWQVVARHSSFAASGSS